MKNGQIHINLEVNRLHANWEDIEAISLFTSESERIIHKKFNELTTQKSSNLSDIEHFYLEVENTYKQEKNNGIHKVLLLLKAVYSSYSNLIPAISSDEMESIFNRIYQSKILTSIDLKLVGDLTTYFTVAQLKAIAPKFFRSNNPDLELRPRIFQIYIPICQSNIADILIDNKEFETATLLLFDLKELSKHNNNFFYYFQAHFLNYRLLYLTVNSEKEELEILECYEK